MASGEKTAVLNLKGHRLLAKLGGDCLISKEADSEAYHLVHSYVKETLVDNEGAKKKKKKLQELSNIYTGALDNPEQQSTAQILCK